MLEFDLIARCLAGRGPRRRDVVIGPGDDGAVLRPAPGQELVVSTDLMVSGVHFDAGADPESLGHKALAVNLSDLAAMGAEPAWASLGLVLPAGDEAWLQGFAGGFAALAERFGVALVGGDLTRGPVTTIAVTVQGLAPPRACLRRSGARPGDLVFVTGTPGDAAMGLALATGRLEAREPHRGALLQRLRRPSPRVAEGLDLRGLASAAIDVSDGLAQDLGQLLAASGAGATLELARLPRSDAMAGAFPGDAGWDAVLAGGDDYELCFALPPERAEALAARSTRWGCRCTRVGVVEARPGLRCVRADGSELSLERGGYEHFT